MNFLESVGETEVYGLFQVRQGPGTPGEGIWLWFLLGSMDVLDEVLIHSMYIYIYICIYTYTYIHEYIYIDILMYMYI